MKRRNNRKYYVAILLGVVLTLSLGFAIFSDILNISGSAKTTGNFDIVFKSATIGSSSHAGTPTAVISTDKKTLTLAAEELAQPGATVTYNVQVENAGSIRAELLNATISGDNDPDITVSIAPSFTNGTLLDAAETYDFTITVTWSTDSTVGDKTLNYTVELNYQQAS